MEAFLLLVDVDEIQPKDFDMVLTMNEHCKLSRFVVIHDDLV
jgi:hypothetical protein